MHVGGCEVDELLVEGRCCPLRERRVYREQDDRSRVTARLSTMTSGSSLCGNINHLERAITLRNIILTATKYLLPRIERRYSGRAVVDI